MLLLFHPGGFPMAVKTKKSDAKQMEITTAALKLFFEKGYEGTSIRMIQEKISKKPPILLFPFKRRRF